jgi:hypothetical protein
MMFRETLFPKPTRRMLGVEDLVVILNEVKDLVYGVTKL